MWILSNLQFVIHLDKNVALPRSQKFILVLLISVLASCRSTQHVNTLWNELPNDTEVTGSSIPSEYLVYRLDYEAFKEEVSTLASDTATVKISIPDPLGELREYRVSRSGIVAQELLEKYPDLAAYKGESTDELPSKIRFELPEESLQLMGTTTSKTWMFQLVT